MKDEATPEQIASGEGWPTIDSAPKDGSEIIAICASAYSPTAHETWWQDGWTHYSRPDEKWHGGVGKWFPTHWMPMPALSTTSEAPEAGRLRAKAEAAILAKQEAEYSGWSEDVTVDPGP